MPLAWNVITMSGRTRRTARTKGRRRVSSARRANPPSGSASCSSDRAPRARAAAAISRSRRSPSARRPSDAEAPIVPASPRVAVTKCTSCPSAVRRASVAPGPKVSSSGWANRPSTVKRREGDGHVGQFILPDAKWRTAGPRVSAASQLTLGSSGRPCSDERIQKPLGEAKLAKEQFRAHRVVARLDQGLPLLGFGQHPDATWLTIAARIIGSRGRRAGALRSPKSPRPAPMARISRSTSRLRRAA